jgi:nicotinamidase-related amidase
VKLALLIIDYTESCCLEKYERPEWGCTFKAVRALAPRLIALLDAFRQKRLGEVVWAISCPWTPGRVHSNIEAHYTENPEFEFYSDGTGAACFYEVQPRAEEKIFEKNLYSAFSGSGGSLHAYLQKQEIERLAIAGVYSTGCVNATICEAFHLGYRLSIISDCVETFDRDFSQEHQRHLIREWGYMYGKVETAAGLANQGA